MNMYDKKSICCSKCDRFIGEIDEDAIVVLPKCGKCADPFPEGDDKVQYTISKIKRGERELSSQTNTKISSAMRKLFVILVVATIFSTIGLSGGAYAQTLSAHNGQGHQFSQHGNFTGHRRTGGSYNGTFPRNETGHDMNSFNHTKNESHRGNYTASGNNMSTKGSVLSSSPDATTAGIALSYAIPSWVKSNAKFWSQGQLGDSDFVSGMQYLVQHGIMKIPPSSSATSSSASQQIPSWIKTNAGYWAGGDISDGDFVKGIQYLISNGMIKIS